MKELYKELNFSLALWWAALIFWFVIMPIHQVNNMRMNGAPIEPEWWMYLLGILVWDWFWIVFMVVLSMIGMVLVKLHNFLTKGAV